LGADVEPEVYWRYTMSSGPNLLAARVSEAAASFVSARLMRFDRSQESSGQLEFSRPRRRFVTVSRTDASVVSARYFACVSATRAPLSSTT
jgi:hypothetical protein